MVRCVLCVAIGLSLLFVMAGSVGGAPAADATVTTGGSQVVEDDLRRISVGETREGRIDTGDPRSSEFRGYYEPVTMQASAGDRVTIDLTSTGDTYLFLVGPNGNVIGEDDDGGEGLNSRLRTTLPSDGEYTIIATSYDSDATFDYTLSVSRSAQTRSTEDPDEPTTSGADARSVSPGETITSSIDPDDPWSSEYRGYHEPVTFQGSADDRVSIRMRSQGDTHLFLVGPDGDVIARDDDGGEGLNSQLQTTLPNDGEYTIIATSYDSDATFDYTLSFEQVELDADGSDVRSITYGSMIQSDLERSDPESLDYNGYYEPITFRGYADETITAGMRSQGDTYLYLVGPDGDVIAQDDDGGEDLNSQLRTTLPSDGEYTIIATSYDSDATFDYTLSLTGTNLDPQREEPDESEETDDEEEEDDEAGNDSSALGPGFGVLTTVGALLLSLALIRRT